MLNSAVSTNFQLKVFLKNIGVKDFAESLSTCGAIILEK